MAVSNSACPTAALPHVAGFPVLGVLRRLRPIQGLLVGIDTYPPHPWQGCGEGGTRMVPMFT